MIFARPMQFSYVYYRKAFLIILPASAFYLYHMHFEEYSVKQLFKRVEFKKQKLPVDVMNKSTVVILASLNKRLCIKWPDKRYKENVNITTRKGQWVQSSNYMKRLFII